MPSAFLSSWQRHRHGCQTLQKHHQCKSWWSFQLPDLARAKMKATLNEWCQHIRHATDIRLETTHWQCLEGCRYEQQHCKYFEHEYLWSHQYSRRKSLHHESTWWSCDARPDVDKREETITKITQKFDQKQMQKITSDMAKMTSVTKVMLV